IRFAQLLPQEFFFYTRFDIDARGDERAAGECDDRSPQQHGRDNRKQKTRVDRMTDESVRAGIDDVVMLLACHGTRPELPEMNARPPREQEATDDEGSQEPANAGSNVP